MKANNSIFILLSFLFFTIKTFAQAPELILPTTHYAMSVVISTDDKWLVSAGEGEVKIWNNETGQLIKNLKFGNSDGFYVATNSNGSEISGVLNMISTGDAVIMAISPDNKTLAMASKDSLAFFSLDRFVFGKKISISDPIKALTFSTDSHNHRIARRNHV